MMADLVAFLHARLNEDETWGMDPECGYYQDPDRVLREVEAKRAILAEHDVRHDPCDAHNASLESIPCPTLELLAAVYRDHPDYDPTWKP
jgi:Family of unknown function (DUF6221)